MANPVTHFEVNAVDAKGAQKFYGDLFGWRIENTPLGYGMIDTRSAGQGIGGGIGATQTGRSWVTFYVETPDLAASLAKAERLGGKTLVPPTEMGTVAIALFTDPEGNVIGLVKSAAQPPRRQPRVRRTVVKKAAKKTATKATPRKAATRRTVPRRPARPARRRRS